MPHFICIKNPDGHPQPPKVTAEGKEVQICLKGSSKDKVCVNDKCTFVHIFNLGTITNGVKELNTWLSDTDGVKWSSTKNAAAAAKTKPKVTKENTGKKSD